ncbi:MAG: ribonuclease R [Pseudomonadota bacterium]
MTACTPLTSNTPSPSIPSKAELLEYVDTQPHPVSLRDLVRDLEIEKSQHIQVINVLKELMAEGKLTHQGELLHKVDNSTINVVEVTGFNLQGFPSVRLAHWSGESKAPSVTLKGFLETHNQKLPVINIGDRLLVRLKKTGRYSYEGLIVRVISSPQAQQLVGRFIKTSQGGLIEPGTLQFRSSVPVNHASLKLAKSGDIVVAGFKARHGCRRGIAYIKHNLGSIDDPGTISQMALYEHALPHNFSTQAVRQAESARLPELGDRQDLRQIPLVTIDGEDARDFDDAVWAEPDTDPNNPGGWHALVAIADVSYYVRDGDPLDQEAQKRCNSVYFPDRVVPMLPEALSNEMCSLKPDVERACLAVHMWFDAHGNRLKHQFVRGLMRSAARLTYSQVQTARDTQDTKLAPYIDPLYGVFAALRSARQRRGTLDFDRVETRILVDEKGQIQKLAPQPSLDSHKLIEELMIASNVAAATTLEQTRLPCMYRTHDKPDALKLIDTLPFLKSIGIKIAQGPIQSAATLGRILKQCAATKWAPTVSDLLLRSMAQARYNTKNNGHYGLQLKRYCHFTSPIRRYADLLVHRALIKHIESDPEPIASETWKELGVRLSETERKADKASRVTNDRFVARHLKDRVGDTFNARINSVTNFGIFITEENTGAEGLIHTNSLPNDYYVFEPRRHQLIGRSTRQQFTLGDKITVRLEKADELTGKLEFGLLEK